MLLQSTIILNDRSYPSSNTLTPLIPTTSHLCSIFIPLKVLYLRITINPFIVEYFIFFFMAHAVNGLKIVRQGREFKNFKLTVFCGFCPDFLILWSIWSISLCCLTFALMLASQINSSVWEELTEFPVFLRSITWYPNSDLPQEFCSFSRPVPG